MKPRIIPKYRLHRPSDQAVVRLDGHDHYLGRHGTPESHSRYDQAVAAWLNARTPPAPVAEPPRAPLTVSELILAYWKFVVTYYVKDGRPTSEQTSIRLALRVVRRLFGRARIEEFGPKALAAVRDAMVEQGLTRKRINQHVSRVRRMFEWGVSEEIVDVVVLQALKTVRGLRAGRSPAKESEPIKPVGDDVLEATLPHLSPQLRAMVMLQRLSGCRPGEIIILRPRDVDRSSDLWVYRPESHKTEHHGRSRLVVFGPRAQAILAPWLERSIHAFCFSPAEVRRRFDDARRAARKSKRYGVPRRLAAPKKRPGDRYTTTSYGRAVRNACRAANTIHWSPNQLRHTSATEVRARFGLEAAQVVLGHARADVSQIYAERDVRLAVQVMREVG